MTISNMNEFTKAIKSAGSRGRNLEKLFGEAMVFVYNQAIENGNSSPAMMFRENIPAFICKPKGMSQKNLDRFMEVHGGFTWNKASKSYKKDKGANPVELPDQGASFWNHEVEKPTREFRLDHELDRIVKRARDNGESDDAIRAAFEKALLTAEQTLAASLGIAA